MTNLPSMIQIPRFHFLPFPSIRTRITDGFPKDFKTAWGDTVGCDFAIDVLFLDYHKCLDLIFIHLSGLMISIWNLQLLKHASVADKCSLQERNVVYIGQFYKLGKMRISN